jgi:hypothetical protein
MLARMHLPTPTRHPTAIDSHAPSPVRTQQSLVHFIMMYVVCLYAMLYLQITAEFMGNSSLLGTLASAVKDLADAFNEMGRVAGLAERVHEVHASIEALQLRLAASQSVRRSEVIGTSPATCCVLHAVHALYVVAVRCRRSKSARQQ